MLHDTSPERRPRSGRHPVFVVLAMLLSSILVSGSPAPSVAATDIPSHRRVTLISDSVGLGVRYDLHHHFPDNWDIDVMGRKSVSIGQLERDFVRPNLGRLGDHVVIAAGYNFPFDGGLAPSIDSMIDSLTQAGVEHVYWVTLREIREGVVSERSWERIQDFNWYFSIVNDALEAAVGRHPELTLIDWSVAADRPGLTTDAIHLNLDGIDLYGSLIRQAVGDSTVRPPNGGLTRVNVADPDAVAAGRVEAVALNLTSVRSRADGYLSAFPCEEGSDGTSSLNHRRATTVAAAAIVRVGPSGDVCVYNQQAGHVVVDVLGRFGSETDLLDTATQRVLDSRSAWPLLADASQPVSVLDPTTSTLGADQTVVLNLTAVQPRSAGFATVHDCASGPGDTSNVNFDRGATTPNLVVTRTDSDGKVCMTSTAITHVLVDVLAVFGPTSAATATPPERLVDTRLWDSQSTSETVMFEVPSTGDGGVIGNLTIAGARSPGFATAYPCAAGRPETSNINFDASGPIANVVAVAPDREGRICVFTSSPAHVIFDLMATTGPGFVAVRPARAFDSRV